MKKITMCILTSILVMASVSQGRCDKATTGVKRAYRTYTQAEQDNGASTGTSPKEVLNTAVQPPNPTPTDVADKKESRIEEARADQAIINEYTVGIDDILEINIIQPEKIATMATVLPDGSISVPYIGTINVKDKTLSAVQTLIEQKLSDGYMKYPVVSVALRESRSRKFFVYGEVIKPGGYMIQENTTVLRAISEAGGFTRFGSSSRVKVLRAVKDGPGYQTIKVNIKEVMNGNAGADVVLQSGDIVVVSEGVF